MALNNVMEYACEIGALTQKYHVIGSETLGEGCANATSTDVTAVQSATSSAVDEANEMLKLRSPRARRSPAEHLQQQTAAVGHQLLIASVLPSHRISETLIDSLPPATRSRPFWKSARSAGPDQGRRVRRPLHLDRPQLTIPRRRGCTQDCGRRRHRR